MAIFDVINVKFKKHWSIESIYVSRSYAGLMEGSPHDEAIKEIFNEVIHEVTKNASDFGEQAINRVPRFQENGLLKPLWIDVQMINDYDEKKVTIMTFIDETEDTEIVLTEIMNDPLFVVGELVY